MPYTVNDTVFILNLFMIFILKLDKSILLSSHASKNCFNKCLFYSGFMSFQQYFNHIAMVSGCGRELNAHF